MTYPEMIQDQIRKMESCLAWMPKNDHMRSKLTLLFTGMIGFDEVESMGRMWSPQDRLTWLCDAFVDEIGEWPKRGLAELRGLYCCYFKPADRIEGRCELENPPSPRRLPIDDGIPRIGASPVDTEFQSQFDGVVAKVSKR